MPEHVHVHAPHELTETGHSVSGQERILEFIAVLLLSVATVCIAWSGYQAAKWSGHQAQHYTAASTAKAKNGKAGLVSPSVSSPTAAANRTSIQIVGTTMRGGASHPRFRANCRDTL